MKRRILSMLLMVCLTWGLLPTAALAAEGEDDCSTWDGSVDTSWYREEEDEFTISTAAQLAGVAELVNSGHDFSGKAIILDADISLNRLEWTTIGKTIPYGGTSYMFSGLFDGAGHTITEWYVADQSDCTGLFGNVDGTIMNLHLAQSVIYSTRKAKGSIGGFVSRLYQKGQIYGCTSDVSITIGRGSSCGGIAGLSAGAIIKCVNYGTIDGWDYSNCGGIVGQAVGRIEGCINYGAVSGEFYVGGIAGNCGFTSMNGYGDIEIQNCQNYGAISGKSTCGGIAGDMTSYYQDRNFCRINACLNTGEVSCEVDVVGGIVGESSGDDGGGAVVTNCYNTGVVSGSQYIGGIAGNAYGDNSRIGNCYSLGRCEGFDRFGAIVGLLGYNQYLSESTNAIIINCYYLQGSASAGVGMFMADDGQVEVRMETIAYTAGQMQSSRFCNNLNTTNGSMPNSGTWSYSPDENGGYPFLTSNSGLNTPSDVNGVNPEVSSLYIVGFSGRELVMDGVQDKAIAVFNRDIVKGSTSRSFAIRDLDAGRMVLLLPVESEHVRATADCLTIDVGALDLPSGRTYSVTVPPGAVESADGDVVFYGLEDPTAWVFTIPQDLLLDAEGGVTMEWAKNSWFPLFRENDYTKPPVPAGTDGEYAALLSDWAWSCGYELTEAEATELLDEPMYLPVTSLSGDSFLLNDNATTVRQVMEDILFTANLQPYLDELDTLLAQVENSTGEDTAWGQIAGILSAETEAYELAVGWYDQVNRHMTDRAEESNFFLSLAAPIAYQLLMEKVAAGQTGPVVKAQLALVENEAALSTIGGLETYQEFKQTVKDVGTAGQGLSAAYTAYVDGNPKNLVRFGFDLLEEHWSGAGSGMLDEITGAYQEISSAKSAVQLCMFLGSSIGYFPMVVDLYQDLNSSRYNQVKTAYFLADYYVAEKDPELYEAILGLDDGMLHSSSYVWTTFPSEALDYELALENAKMSSDPVIANWARFVDTGGMVDLDEEDIAMLRRDITNYAAILRYAKSVDAEAAIEALVACLEAEAKQESRTAVAVSCPVTVNLYDASGDLVASLSSDGEKGSIDSSYGTLYLLGENGETKYFYLNSADYRVEIVPYDAGTMDVTITRTEEDGMVSGVYYEGVALETGKTFSTSTDVSADAVLTETTSGTTIPPEDELPVTSLRIEGPREVAVGGSARLTAAVSPVTATDKAVSWVSSDPSVLEVSQDGTLTALSVGRATVTAAAESGVTASAEVSVYVPAAALTAGERTRSLLVGESCRLDMAVTGEPTHAVTWSSSSAGVASVEADGTVHALSAGSAVVTAEIDGLRQDVTVTVYEQPIQVTLYQSDAPGMRVKADVTNLSAGQSFSGNVFLALYEGVRMVGITRLTDGLAAGETATCYYPLENLNPDGAYSVSVFVLDDTGAPMLAETGAVILA